MKSVFLASLAMAFSLTANAAGGVYCVPSPNDPHAPVLSDLSFSGYIAHDREISYASLKGPIQAHAFSIDANDQITPRLPKYRGLTVFEGLRTPQCDYLISLPARLTSLPATGASFTGYLDIVCRTPVPPESIELACQKITDSPG